MEIKPLNDNVVIKPDEKASEIKTKSGLYLNTDAQETKGNKQGKVIAVGPGALSKDGNKRLEMSVKKGDVVLYSWGDSVEIEGVSYEIVSESHILGILTK